MEKTVETNNYGEVKLHDNELDILELIRKLRNDLIKDFLDDRHLKQYLQSNYAATDLSVVKIEFIRKALKELLISPINSDHYKPIIDEIKSNERTSLAEGNEQLFYKELGNIFRKFIY